MNLNPGGTAANAVVSEIGADGSVCVYSSAGAHIVADLAGYVGAAGQDVSVSPVRLLDTRSGVGGTTGPVAGGATVPVTVTMNGRPVPAGSTVLLNVTAVDSTAAGHVTVWACGGPMPASSNLNPQVGAVVPNLVLAKAGTGGTVCLYTARATQLIADLVATVAAGANATLVSVAPGRLVDTRSGLGAIGLLGPGRVIEVDVPSGHQVPASASAVALNITATEPGRAGWVVAWPCGQPQPATSNLNVQAGETRANLAVVRMGTAGKVCMTSSMPTHLIVDSLGYAPSTSSLTAIQPVRVLDTRER